MPQDIILTVPIFLESAKDIGKFCQFNDSKVLDFCLRLLSDRDPGRNEVGYIGDVTAMTTFASLLEKYDKISILNLTFNSLDHLPFEQWQILINALKKLKLTELILNYNDLHKLDENTWQLILELINCLDDLKVLSLVGNDPKEKNDLWDKISAKLILLAQSRNFKLLLNNNQDDELTQIESPIPRLSSPFDLIQNESRTAHSASFAHHEFSESLASAEYLEKSSIIARDPDPSLVAIALRKVIGLLESNQINPSAVSMSDLRCADSLNNQRIIHLLYTYEGIRHKIRENEKEFTHFPNSKSSESTPDTNDISDEVCDRNFGSLHNF